MITISRQIYKQWKEGSSEGVSKWLFIGQMTANCGFLIYSWLVKNWVFVATNFFMICSALTGLSIVLHHRRRAGSGDEPQRSSNNLGVERA